MSHSALGLNNVLCTPANTDVSIKTRNLRVHTRNVCSKIYGTRLSSEMSYRNNLSNVLLSLLL